MTQGDPKLLLQPAPFLKRGVTTPGLMGDVLLAIAPSVLAALYFFGLSALLVLLASTLGAVLAERLWSARRGSLRDGSGALTGLLLGLTLPPAIPAWMAFLGGMTAIGLGKIVWGGLGQNLFNPALVGRAFLQAAFPRAMTTWSPAGGLGSFLRLSGTTFALPLMSSGAHIVTTASPLARMKFEHAMTPLASLFWGQVAGSLGETSGALILLGGLFLLMRRALDWRIPISIFSSVALLSGILYAIGPEKYPSPVFMLFSGGLMFGAIFMATDPVTSPLAPRGAWIFGAGIGVLVVLIRIFGGLPEGVMYSILLMNAASPLIDRSLQPRPFGRKSS